MQGICAGFLGEGSPALILKWTWPSGEDPGVHKRRGLVNGSVLHLMVLFGSPGSISAGGLEVKMVFRCSLFPGLGSSGPHRCAVNHRSCVPSFCYIPGLTLCLSWPPASSTALLGFILGVTVFQNPKLQRNPSAQTHTNHLGEGLTMLWLVPACPRERLRVYGKSQHTAGAKVCCPSRGLCSYAGKWGSSMVPAGSFARREVASTQWTPSRGAVSPHATQGPSDRVAHSWGSIPFPHHSVVGHWALKLQTLHSATYKKLVVLEPSLFSRSLVLKNIFLMQSPVCVFTLFFLHS